MAGALTISTLNNDTGVLATQNGMTGINGPLIMEVLVLFLTLLV